MLFPHLLEKKTVNSKNGHTINGQNIELINEDCLNINLIKKDSIDLTVTSPPYNVDLDYNSYHDKMSYQSYLEFTKKYLTNIYEWTKSEGRLCLNVPQTVNKGGTIPTGADITTVAQSVGWKYHTTIIWHKANVSKRTAWGSWKSAKAPYIISPTEIIIVFYKHNWNKSDEGKDDILKDEFIQWTNGLWEFTPETNRKRKHIQHPAPFPEELPRRCIKLMSYQDDTILDPFMGSGTTGIVAYRNHRKFIGIEIDKKYYKQSLRRLQIACSKGKVIATKNESDIHTEEILHPINKNRQKTLKTLKHHLSL